MSEELKELSKRLEKLEEKFQKLIEMLQAEQALRIDYFVAFRRNK